MSSRERKSRVGLKLPIPAREDAFAKPMPLPLPLPKPPNMNGACKLPCVPLEEVTLEDLQKISTLGCGSSGKVYKVKHVKTGKIYALKIIQEKHELAVRKQIMREMEILRRANSPHIVQCYGIFDRGGEISFVLEYMDGGTLAQVLQAHKKIPEHYLAEVARQVLKGLHYLHQNKIVHRDIKPSNLLINKRREVKIAEFGVSTVLAHTLAQCNSFVGTCAYMSPERFDPDGYGGKYDGCSADIWSLGLSLLECALGRFPCLSPGQRPDWPTLMVAICLGDPPSPPPDASLEFQDFIRCCLQKDALLRHTAQRLLSHPFLKKYGQQSCDLSPLLQALHL